MGGTCEAPSELYARDTDGRGAGSHSPFLSLPPAYPSLAEMEKTSGAKSHSGTVANSREKERENSEKSCGYLDMKIYVYSGSPRAGRGRNSRPSCSEAPKALAWPLSLRIEPAQVFYVPWVG